MPKGNDVESTDISITESQFSSTMPFCEESLVAKLDPVGESQFLSAQPCHKEDTTFPHESANSITEEGTSDDSTKDCSSGTSASKIPTEVIHVKFDSVSDINTESQVDHGNLQSSEISNIEESSCLSDGEGTFDYDTVPSAKAKSIEPSEPVKLRRSTRSTKGIPPTRYGLVISHKVGVPSKFGKWLSSISKKVDSIYDHMFDLHNSLFIVVYAH